MSLLPNEVKTEHISAGAVVSTKLAVDSVTTEKIKDGAIKTEKIATGAVTGSKIADNTIYGSKLRDSAVRAEKIAAGAIITAKIAEGAVTGSRLAVNAVTEEKLASNAVTTAKIANGSVTPAKLSFTPPSVARPITPAITSAELGIGSVESDTIANGAVTSAKIANGAVVSDKILDASVGTNKIQDGAITQAKLAPGVGGGSRITFLATRIQLTGLIVLANQDWIPIPPNPSVPPEAVALILQVELINNLNGAVGFINCRIRQDMAQQGCLSLGIDSRDMGKIAGAQAIIPVVSGSFQYSFTDATGVVNVTFNPYVIGYIV